MRRVVAVLSLMLAVSAAVGCGGSDSSTSAAAARAAARHKRLIDSDTKAEVTVRDALAAMEVYAADHNGNYEGATAAELQNIEPRLPLDLAVQAQQPFAYSVTVTSKVSGTAFTAAKAATGSLSYTCSQRRTGTCPASGEWGSS